MPLALVFILSVLSPQRLKSIAAEPPERGLARDDDDEAGGAVPPAMAAFFFGAGGGAPGAESSAVPKWALPSPELHRGKVDGWWRPTMLGVSVVCGVAGIGFLVGWVVALTARLRKPRREVRIGAARMA